MNREILFKAKRKDNGEWVEGNLITNERNENQKYIGYIFDERNGVIEDFDLVEVIPTTICQYTGLTDKNGKKIWENDIIEDDVNCYRVYWSKKYSNFSCEYVKTDEPIFKGRKWDLWSIIQEEEIYVKGNIFDNQELLEVE